MRTKTLLAAFALAVLALTGCTAAPGHATPVSTSVTSPTPTPTAAQAVKVSTPTPTPSPTDCANPPTARINMPSYAYNTEPVTKPELVGEIFDTGPRAHATGDPTLHAGEIASYTVQADDALQAIAARFCMDAASFGAFNHTRGYDLQPGDVLVLRPDPTKPWHWED